MGPQVTDFLFRPLQIVSAVHYCHQKNIVHRDLKVSPPHLTISSPPQSTDPPHLSPVPPPVPLGIPYSLHIPPLFSPSSPLSIQGPLTLSQTSVGEEGQQLGEQVGWRGQEERTKEKKQNVLGRPTRLRMC